MIQTQAPIDPSFVYLVTDAADPHWFRVHKALDEWETLSGVGGLIADILFHPSEGSMARIKQLREKVLQKDPHKEKKLKWYDGLTRYQDQWHLLFLRKGELIDRLGPGFFSINRTVYLPDSRSSITTSLVETDREGYDRQLFWHEVAPVSRQLRDVLLPNEDREPVRELDAGRR